MNEHWENDVHQVPIIDPGHGLSVNRIGFDGMALSHVYGQTDPTDALMTLHATVDAGITFLDTADVYGEPRPGTQGPTGANEELFTQLLRERRGEAQVATRFGITGLIGTPDTPATRGDRTYTRSACEASLRRLGVETIDLYYMHRRQLDLPTEETVGAMADLVAGGKVRHLGLSEVTATELRAAATVHSITTVQSEWSLWSRDVEIQVMPAAREVGAGFVPYSPLGRGFLTGALTPERVAGSMLRSEDRFVRNYEANQQLLQVIRRVADELGATLAQIASAWLLGRTGRLGLPVVPIPGTRSAERVRQSATTTQLRLTDDQVTRLDAAADLVQGPRDLSFTPPQWISSGRK